MQTNFSGPVASANGFINGTATSPVTVTTAQNINSSYGSTSASSGDTRLVYDKLTFTAAGAGETLRAFSVVAGAQGAGQTTNGAHISLSVNTGGTISGAANALRATLGVASGVTPGGTLAALQVDSDVASGVTLPSSASFIRVTNSNTTTIGNLLNVPSAMVVAKGSSTGFSHTIKCVDSAGTVFYLMATTSAPA